MDDKRFLLYNLALESEKIDKKMIDKIIHEFDDAKIDSILTDMKMGELLEAGVVANLLGLVFTTPLWVAWRAASGLASSSRRRCGAFTISSERDVCIKKAKIEEYQKKISIIKQASRDKQNSDKGENVKKQIAKLQEKITKLKQQASIMAHKRHLNDRPK